MKIVKDNLHNYSPAKKIEDFPTFLQIINNQGLTNALVCGIILVWVKLYSLLAQ